MLLFPIKCSSYSPSNFFLNTKHHWCKCLHQFFFLYVCMQLLMKDNDWQKHMMYKCIKLLCIQRSRQCWKEISWDRNFQYQINSKFRKLTTFLGIVPTTILWFLIHLWTLSNLRRYESSRSKILKRSINFNKKCTNAGEKQNQSYMFPTLNIHYMKTKTSSIYCIINRWNTKHRPKQ